MRWDLGILGLAVLAGLSLAFGLIAHLIVGRRFRRTWLVAAAAYFVAGLLISEAWFGWATPVELQPNIDGLSFDEVLIVAPVGLVVAVVVRYLLRRNAASSPGSGSGAGQPRPGV
jgi:hypothetical protein